MNDESGDIIAPTGLGEYTTDELLAELKIREIENVPL